MFKFQLNVCNRCFCNDALIMSINLCYIAILNIQVIVFCCIITGISKRDVTNVLQNANLVEKGGVM